MSSGSWPSASGPEEVLLKGGLLLDGSGMLPRVEDLRLGQGRILERGRDLAGKGATVLELPGHFVAPGFVDVHSHSDMTVLANPGLESKALQGVTTEVVGNCGGSLFPLSAEHRDELRTYVEGFYPGVPARLSWDWSDLPSWTERVHAARPAVNLAPLVGHGTIRIAVAGLQNEPLSPEAALDAEMWVARSLRDGAFGLSTGLAYSPELNSRSTDLEPFVRQVARYGAVYATHMRDEGRALRDSVAESIDLAETYGARLEISHLKCLGRGRWGLAPELLATIAAARARGVDVRADAYPYEAAETGLFALFPGWATEGTWAETERRLGDPRARDRLRREVSAGVRGWSLGPEDLLWRDIVVSAVATRRGEAFVGRSFSEIAEDVGIAAFDVAIDLFLAEKGGVSILLFGMSPADVRTLEHDPETLVGSDGIGNSLTNGPLSGPIHPRNYGTFPKFVSDLTALGPLALARGVRRACTLPCLHFGIPDRGTLSVGSVADIAVWPSDRRDPGPDYRDRPRYARLFSSVWVAGAPVVFDSRITGVRPGRVLSHSMRSAPGLPS
jgi:N-acyl-D-amino-acid deacylase